MNEATPPTNVYTWTHTFQDGRPITFTADFTLDKIDASCTPWDYTAERNEEYQRWMADVVRPAMQAIAEPRHMRVLKAAARRNIRAEKKANAKRY